MELQHSSNHHSCKRGPKDDDEDDGDGKLATKSSIKGAKNGQIGNWQQQFPANRIYRVSRGSGGKDRHSKVYTAKGLRDRRVRLSVSTAIRFYDLQDRLGYDQPSKAIEWLLKAAASAINDLPELDIFPKPLCSSQEDWQMVADTNSTSDTSKGSVKDKECENSNCENNLPVTLSNPTSFTELLTSRTGHNSSPNSNIIRKPISTADYFSFSQQPQAPKTHHPQMSSGFSSQTQQQQQSHFGNSSTGFAMMPVNIAAAPEMQQQFSFMQDNLNEYNFNFSSSLAGFNRGTLQSNLQPQLPDHHNQIQRISSLDGSTNLPFFLSVAASTPAVAENEFLNSLDGRLQLCYGEGFRHSDMKGKGKS